MDGIHRRSFCRPVALSACVPFIGQALKVRSNRKFLRCRGFIAVHVIGRNSLAIHAPYSHNETVLKIRFNGGNVILWVTRRGGNRIAYSEKACADGHLLARARRKLPFRLGQRQTLRRLTRPLAANLLPPYTPNNNLITFGKKRIKQVRRKFPHSR